VAFKQKLLFPVLFQIKTIFENKNLLTKNNQKIALLFRGYITDETKKMVKCIHKQYDNSHGKSF